MNRFLFNRTSRELLIFLFFLLLSGVFWLILTLNETYEREIKVTMQIKGVPKNVVLTSNETDTLRVTVRDKGWILVRYLYEKTATSTSPSRITTVATGMASPPHQMLSE